MKQVPHETLNGTTTRSPTFELGHARPDLGDDAHRLVAEDVALAEERAEHLVEVQVRAADPGGGDLDDHVGRVLDRRVGHGVDADVALAVPGQCPHVASFPEPGCAEPGWAISRCIRPLTESGNTFAASPWALVPSPPATSFFSPFISAAKPCSRDLRGAVLAARAHLRVVHVGAVEEVGLGRAGHQRGDGHPAVLELLPQRLGERLHERLRCVVDGLEAARHRRGDRRGEQHPPLPAPRHVAQHELRQADGRADVGVDDLLLVGDVGVEERAAHPTPALSAAAASGRPVAPTAAQTAFTPSLVRRSACTSCTAAPPAPRSSLGRRGQARRPRRATRSNPFSANCRASS